MIEKKNICIITSNAGHCHHSTENTIKQILNKYSIYNVISFEVCNDIYSNYDPLHKIFRIRITDIYNKIIIRKSKTRLLWFLILLCSKLYIKLREKTFISIFNKILEYYKPALVISVVPLFNDIFCKSTIKYKIPFLTVMIDLNEFYKSMWFQNKEQLIAVGTEKAFQQAIYSGIAKNNIIRMSGNLITGGLKMNLSINEHNMNFPHKKLKILLIFGGQGSSRLLKYAHEIEKSDLNIEPYYLCGRNEQLLNNLKIFYPNKTNKIFAFIENYSELLSSVDIVVTKPGACSIFESIERGKPLLIEHNNSTLIQERYNSKWVKQNGFGLIFKNSKTLISELTKLICEDTYMQIKKNLENYNNNSALIIEQKILELTA